MMTKPLLIGILGLLFVACEKDTYDSEKTFSPEPFSKVELKSAFNVYLTEGPDYTVTIRWDDTRVDQVEVSVEAGILRLENTESLKWLSPGASVPKVYINSPPLREITAAEGCDIQTLTPITSSIFGLILEGKANQATLELDTRTFYYWNHFPTGGNLTLSGRTEVLQIWNVALTSVNAKNLLADRALVENTSKGDCEVTVLDTLEYRIAGPGNIHLYGNPAAVLPLDAASSHRLIRH